MDVGAADREARCAGVERAIDIVGATLALIALMPLMVIAAIAIKLDSTGPVIFRQVRIGQGFRPFSIQKFRTMVVDAPDADLPLTGGRDPRITRIGRILRKFKLDELPQLLNILNGSMSIIGPRPITRAELNRYGRERRYYLLVRPGITGLWQVSGRSKVRNFEEWVQMDLAYIDRWSLGLDVQILARTVLAVLRATGE